MYGCFSLVYKALKRSVWLKRRQCDSNLLPASRDWCVVPSHCFIQAYLSASFKPFLNTACFSALYTSGSILTSHSFFIFYSWDCCHRKRLQNFSACFYDGICSTSVAQCKTHAHRKNILDWFKGVTSIRLG